jgi:hypothetical protein
LGASPLNSLSLSSMFFLVPIHGVGIPKKKIHLDGISEFLLR